jgi:hypothetical protein
MEAKELTPDSLNEQQLLMLRLLKKPLPENSFIQIRQLAVKLLANQLDETIEEWEVQNGITEKGYDQMMYSGQPVLRSSICGMPK